MNLLNPWFSFDLVNNLLGCDLASAAKPWDCHRKVVNLVTSEFFAQGDRERLELNKEPNVRIEIYKTIKTFWF